ncbi:MAG: hypothetical protein QM710_04250 [Flavobacterium sp.]
MSDTLKKNRFVQRRRNIIPVFLKPFMVLFVLFGLFGIYGITRNAMGIESESSLYGLEATTFFSALGAFIKAMIFFKAYVSVMLWMEKDHAVRLGIIDAVFGIIVCVCVMFVLPFVEVVDGKNRINLRFEILLLIPYLIVLLKMRKQWENFPTDKALAEKEREEITSEIAAKEDLIKNTAIEPETTTVSNTEEIKSNDDVMDKEDPRRFMPQ